MMVDELGALDGDDDEEKEELGEKVNSKTRFDKHIFVDFDGDN